MSAPNAGVAALNEMAAVRWGDSAMVALKRSPEHHVLVLAGSSEIQVLAFDRHVRPHVAHARIFVPTENLRRT